MKRVFFLLSMICVAASVNAANVNGTLMQGFTWTMNTGGDLNNYPLWTEISSNASYYSSLGITAVWLPSPFKAFPDGGIRESASAEPYIADKSLSGGNGVGYAIYDHYDLGEFNQMGSIRTKYGTKGDYINAIKALHAQNIQVYGELIMNHQIGGSDITVTMDGFDRNNRTKFTGSKSIKSEFKFNYPRRNNAYSSFKYTEQQFLSTDTDYNNPTNHNTIYKFANYSWELGDSNASISYLLGAEYNFMKADVKAELKKWALWYTNKGSSNKWSTDSNVYLDGFRMDAVKHYPYDFQKDLITTMQTQTGNANFFAVGEYWDYGVNPINNYITATGGKVKVFDFPLQGRMKEASRANGSYNMATILDNSLVKSNPIMAVTFVDNHDISNERGPNDYVYEWFKPLGYALTLLRKDGYPTIYYGDLYGSIYGGTTYISSNNKTIITKLAQARKNYAYGNQTDYFDNADIVGWTRSGDTTYTKTMAVIISDNGAGSKYMKTGKAGKSYKDYTGNRIETITTDSSGGATFVVNSKSVSVWVEQ